MELGTKFAPDSNAERQSQVLNYATHDTTFANILLHELHVKIQTACNIKAETQ